MVDFSNRPAADTPLPKAFPDHELSRRRTELGTVFSDSNMGYILRGLVIESVTGERYEAWLDKNIQAAIGIPSSTFEFTTPQTTSAQSLLAWGLVDEGSRASSRQRRVI